MLAFPRAAGQSVADALHAGPCTAPQKSETQGEAVAIAADGSSYATISEGSEQPINVFAIAGTPMAAPSTTVIATTTTTTESRGFAGEILARTGAESVRPIWAAVALLAVALVARRSTRHARSNGSNTG